MNLYICKTCNRRIGDDGSNDCPICIPKHLDEPRVWLIEQIGCASHSECQKLPNSTDLLLIAHDEWKRREERKHIHEEIAWTSGWMSGFLTSKKFALERIAELHSKQGGELE